MTHLFRIYYKLIPISYAVFFQLHFELSGMRQCIRWHQERLHVCAVIIRAGFCIPEYIYKFNSIQQIGLATCICTEDNGKAKQINPVRHCDNTVVTVIARGFETQLHLIAKRLEIPDFKFLKHRQYLYTPKISNYFGKIQINATMVDKNSDTVVYRYFCV